MDGIKTNEHLQKNIVYDSYQAEANSKIFVPLVKKYIKDSILDVGAGDGSLLKHLKKSGYKSLEGIELEPKNSFVTKGTVTDIPFNENQFNTVVSTEVFEHLELEQINAGLDEIKRVLKDGRYLILTVPYNENLNDNSVCCPDCGGEFHRYGHLQSFDETRLSDIIKAKGFEPVSIKTYALGAMAKLPLGAYFNFLFKKLKYKSIAITMVIVAKNIK